MKAFLRHERRPRYLPLDELLDSPRTRILRALLRFDWVSTEDLNVALDTTEPALADAYAHHVFRMVREGLVDRRPGVPARLFLYRTNAAGRAYLAAMLERTQPERELGALPEDWQDPDMLTAHQRELRRKMARTRAVNAYMARRRARRAA